MKPPGGAPRKFAEAEPAPGVSGGDLAAHAADGILPPQLLQPHEIIVLLIKPSPWFIVLSSLRSLAVLVVLAMAGVWAHNVGWLDVGRRDIILLAVGVGGLRLFWAFLEWLSRVYVLTDRRVIRVQGVVRVHVFEAQLKQIQHTNALFSLRERLFGLGTIAFATAGTAFIEATWQMVAHPLDVHQTVVQTINRYR